ncbi:chaperone modulator CbpM [Desulfocucumis palustris]|uniref:chaperone modulator CbpM n=1 Tax=Desulfocucumis palustris TaxID=1898651 RepID=UPI000CEA0D74|nr:chaperone modulator CbpM [Desulfocucumis palustris]
MKKYFIQIYCHTPSTDEEDNRVDVTTLGIHPDMAQYLAELGIVDLHGGHIPLRQVGRLQRVLRLRSSLGVNFTGAAIITELLERMEGMQEELERLRRR